jgi:proteic killer suppression protein
LKITFKNNKLEKQLTIPKEMKKTFGTMAKKINQRMKEIEASENLAVLMRIPAANCHELTGDRRREFAVNISVNFRLIFTPDHFPLPVKEDQSVDAIRVIAVRIAGTEDYH